MILYDLSINRNLQDYGIKIPIMEDKVLKVIDYLKKLPSFEANSISKIDEVLNQKDLLRVHSEDYVKKLFSSEVDEEIIKSYELIDNEGNFNRYAPDEASRPLKEIFDCELKKAAGTYQCAKTALKHGFCFYFGGGSHHGKYDYGEGFCIINDVVIAAKKLQADNSINEIWIIDVDAHKGDGTAALTQNDPSIKTLSIHMGDSWPLDGEEYINGKLNPSFLPSDIDIPIYENEENLYIPRLKEGLQKLKTLSKPQLVIVVLGSDPFEKDCLLSTAKLKLSLSQMLERDILIYDFLKAQNIPQAHLMAGGYGNESWRVYAQFLEYVLKFY